LFLNGILNDKISVLFLTKKLSVKLFAAPPEAATLYDRYYRRFQGGRQGNDLTFKILSANIVIRWIYTHICCKNNARI